MTDFLASLLAYNDVGLFVLRVAVAVIFLVHAKPKLVNPSMLAGAFGGNKQAGFVIGLLELISGVSLILGVLPQVTAAILGVIMIGAIYFKMAKWNVPFAAHDKTGWEFDFILLAASITIVLTGGGTIGV